MFPGSCLGDSSAHELQAQGCSVKEHCANYRMITLALICLSLPPSLQNLTFRNCQLDLRSSSIF